MRIRLQNLCCWISYALYHTWDLFPSHRRNKWAFTLDFYNTVSKSLSPPEEIRFCHTIMTDFTLIPSQRLWHACINIWYPYCHKQLLHAIRRHAVQMRQMKLEVHLVAKDVLAEGTADDRLHWVLWQDVHLDTTLVPTIVVTIRTLIELENIE